MHDPLGDYANRLGRPQGPVLRSLGLVVPGVRRVAAQIEPYAAAWAAANREALAADGPLWVALGDSMSQGIGASAWDAGWVGRVRDALVTRGEAHRVVNLSASGARTQDVVEAQLPLMGRLGVTPDLVTVLVGANDLGSRARRARLLEAWDRLIALLPDASVVATMPQPVAAAHAVNEAIGDAVRDRGFVPVTVDIGWRGRLAEDHFHPNDAGYELIAEAFIEAIGAARHDAGDGAGPVAAGAPRQPSARRR